MHVTTSANATAFTLLQLSPLNSTKVNKTSQSLQALRLLEHTFYNSMNRMCILRQNLAICCCIPRHLYQNAPAPRVPSCPPPYRCSWYVLLRGVGSSSPSHACDIVLRSGPRRREPTGTFLPATLVHSTVPTPPSNRALCVDPPVA